MRKSKKKDFIVKNGKLLKIDIEDTYNKTQAVRELAILENEISQLNEERVVIVDYLKSLKPKHEA